MAKKTGKTKHEMARRRYAAGRNVTITNPSGLASLVSEVVSDRFGGSVAQAARESSLPRALLRRVMAGQQRSVRTDNIERLRSFVRGRKSEVEPLILSADVRERLDQYEDWITAQFKHAILGAPAGQPVVGRAGDRLVAERAHIGAHSSVLFELRRRFPREWEPLEQALTGKHYKRRSELAFSRIVGPLLDYRHTSGIERSLGEFSNEELRIFIKAGVKRECLLLSRESDVQRAQGGQRTRTTMERLGSARPGADFFRMSVLEPPGYDDDPAFFSSTP